MTLADKRDRLTARRSTPARSASNGLTERGWQGGQALKAGTLSEAHDDDAGCMALRAVEVA